MAYQNNIPRASDALSQSQIDIQNNFGAIQTLVNVDHVDFASSDQGKHKKVTFPVQSAAPAFSIGEIGVYNLLYAPLAQNHLFIQPASGAAFPMTASGIPGGSNSGWTYLPSGALMVWGIGFIPAGPGSLVVLYSSVPTFPGFTTATSFPQLTVRASGTSPASVTWGTATLTQFDVFRSTGTAAVSFGWLVIGK